MDTVHSLKSHKISELEDPNELRVEPGAFNTSCMTCIYEKTKNEGMRQA